MFLVQTHLPQNGNNAQDRLDLVKLIEVEMACLAFPPPSSSFLLSFFLLCFFFGGVFQIFGCVRCVDRELERKRENKLGCFLFLQENSLALFLACWPRALARWEGGFCFISFSFCQSCSKIQYTLIAHHLLVIIHVLAIKSCLLLK